LALPEDIAKKSSDAREEPGNALRWHCGKNFEIAAQQDTASTCLRQKHPRFRKDGINVI
jgi:hypothetical protein